MKRKESLAKDMTSKTKDLETQIATIEKEVGDLRKQLDGRKETIEQLTKESRDAEEEKAKLDDERRCFVPSAKVHFVNQIGNCGDLKQRYRPKKTVEKTSFERLNSNCTIPWIETFKPVSMLPLVSPKISIYPDTMGLSTNSLHSPTTDIVLQQKSLPAQGQFPIGVIR